MECARVAARRGHRVTLVDDNETLGGTLAVLARDPNRSEFARHVAAMTKTLQDLGVNVQLRTRVTAGDVAGHQPDVVVIAAGATERRPDVPGADASNVVTALDVLRGRCPVHQSVVVVGGLDDHLPPLTVCDYLAQQGRDVTLLTETDGIGVGIELATRLVLIRRLLEQGVVLERLTALVAAGDNHVEVRNTFTNEHRRIEGIDTVVAACGRRSRTNLAEQLRGMVPALHVIGDALSPRRMVNATLDGARVGVSI
jgi:NADPH-dependent 2,4-dienoyl-CoA reductase/sulfur reductase-like enzyme